MITFFPPPQQLAARLLALFLLCASSGLSFGQVAITSFTPTSGIAGTATVTITGSGFNTTTTNNVVYFGATRATVNTATATSLEVTVPVGATHSALTVLNTVSGLSTRSMQMFLPVYSPSTTANGFDNKVTVTGTAGLGVALGDINGDGKADVIVGNQGASTVDVFPNTSTSGAISFGSRQFFSVGPEPREVIAVDFDNDGKLDVATSTGNLGGIYLSVLRNTSTGGATTFATVQNLSAANNVGSLTSYDYDNDGWQDLIMVTTTTAIYRNISTVGNINFAAPVNIAAVGKVTSGDIDGDGKADLVLCEGDIKVMLNTSSGSISFGSAQSFSLPAGANKVTLSDIDGDGKRDILFTRESGAANKVSVFRNLSTPGNVSLGTIQDFSTAPIGANSGPFDLAVADFSGDGKPDLAVMNTYDQNIAVYLNTSTSGTIAFAAAVTMNNGSGYNGFYNIAAGDLDGDNRPDIAALSSGGGALAIVRNNPPAPGAALHFDGSNDNASIPNNAGLQLNQFTLETWFNPSTAANFPSPPPAFIAKGATGNPDYFLIPMFGTRKVAAGFWAGGSSVLATSTTDLAQNTWYHLAATFDGTSVRIYVNGVLENTVSAGGLIPQVSSNALSLGLTNTNQYINGALDEVRIWNRALCAAEIQAQRTCELLGTETGLQAYYKFNQGFAGIPNTGNTLTNSASSTGATNNGTLNNFGLTGTTSNWITPGGVTTGSSCSAFTGGNTVSLSSAAGTNAQTVCQNTGITNITYATTNATGANVTGLPTGVTGVWAANVVTISGTPSVSGPFTYTVTLTGGCGTVTATGTITVTAAPAAPTSVAASVPTICSGGSTNLSAVSAGNTIIWYTDATGGSSVGTSATGANLSVSPGTTTTYYAEVQPASVSNQTFSYTGGEQTFTVPAGVTSLTVDAYGAKGGNGTPGGKGGRVQATLPVTPGQELKIYVGGQGGDQVGGYNGGGTGFTTSVTGGGGGASDIRIGGIALANRVIVAGGGGGSGDHCNPSDGYGGNGGGLTGLTGSICAGVNTSYCGAGGSQSAGGVSYGGSGTAGVLGIGGNGGNPEGNFRGGGGGGGYYGGGGASSGGGGGGSSYTGPSVTGVTHTQGVSTGNGQIILSWSGVSCPSARVPVTVTVNPVLAPSVSITGATNNTVCAGTSVTFTATPTNGGTTPTYQWKKGATNVGTGSTYATSSLADGDQISVVMTSNYACPTTPTATSNVLTNTVLDIANASVVTGTSQNVAATHECTDGSGWTHYVKMPGNVIALSIKKNGNTIGTIGDGILVVRSQTTADWAANTAKSIVSGTAPYVENSTWNVMNRWWAVTPNPQPASPVQVKSYYHADDLAGLRVATIDNALSHTQLKFYKINGGGNDPNPANGHSGVVLAANYAADGYWEYNSSTSGTTTTWLWGDLGTNRYSAEYTVASFSGGGGGGSQGGGNSNSAFPVEWLNFDAERVGNGDVMLNWATASETNNVGFEVEQSADGQVFVQIGTVIGAGNSSVRQDYSFRAGNAGAAYYRLRQMDTDGNASYSETRYLAADMAQAWYFAPNPVRGTVRLNGVFAPDSYVRTTVHSVDGRLVLDHIGTDAEAAVNEALSGFAPGLYLFQLRVDGKPVATQQMMVE